MENQDYILTSDQIHFFEKNGYLHLKNFISPEDVVSFRKGCYRAAENPDYQRDTLGIPEFNKFFISKKVISVIGQLLKDDRVQYPGLSQTRADDYARGSDYKMFNYNRGWHVDSIPDDFDYSVDYPLVNTGIYLQDHKYHSDGLKVWPGSHRRPCYSFLNLRAFFKSLVVDLIKGRLKKFFQKIRPSISRNLELESTDFVVWSMRLHHSGFAVRPKLFRKISFPPLVENILPKSIIRPQENKRCVVITAYGRPCLLFDQYIHDQATKEKRKNYYLNSPLNDPAVVSLALKNGVTLRNEAFEYMQNKYAKLNLETLV